MPENTRKSSTKKGEKITFLPAKTSNNTLYLVTVEDDRGPRVFVSKSLDQISFGIILIGYEISNNIKKIESEEQAIALANRESRTLFHITFPWNRVYNIINVTYKIK